MEPKNDIRSHVYTYKNQEKMKIEMSLENARFVINWDRPNIPTTIFMALDIHDENNNFINYYDVDIFKDKIDESFSLLL